MKNGNPQLKRLPPALPPMSSQTDDIARLDALKDWTEAPARAVAESLSEGQGADAQEAPQAPAETTAKEKGRAIENKTPGKPAERVPDYPWNGLKDPDSQTQYLVRWSKKLHMQVKFLGETTYDDSMNKLITRAVEREVAAMLKARGIKQ